MNFLLRTEHVNDKAIHRLRSSHFYPSNLFIFFHLDIRDIIGELAKMVFKELFGILSFIKDRKWSSILFNQEVNVMAQAMKMFKVV